MILDVLHLNAAVRMSPGRAKQHTFKAVIWLGTAIMIFAGWLQGRMIASVDQATVIESLVEVRVNGSVAAEFVLVLRDTTDCYYVPADVLRAARVRMPPGTPLKREGREYYPLSAIPGAVGRFDAEGQVLDIQVPGDALVDSRFDAHNNSGAVPESLEPGVFLNHEFQFSRNTSAGTVSGQVEGGFFSRLGVLTTRVSSSDLTQGASIIRQDTQITRDIPRRRASLTIGDATSAGNAWARQMYFAGVRFASKFSTQPDFLPYSLPSLTGLAVQPSVVDVYVNNQKTISQAINTGPFSISNIPVISGQGDLQMVVTDALGRQQIVSQQYIYSSQLLRKGTGEYTYEAGMPRVNMGIKSFGYRSFFAEGTHRYGLTENLTIEGRGEAGLENQTVGGGVAGGVKGVGILTGGIAGGRGNGRSGVLFYGSFSRPSRVWRFDTSYQGSSDGFRQLGLSETDRPYGQVIQANIGRSFGSRFSVAGGYIQRDGRTSASTRGPLASFSVRIGRATLSGSGSFSLLGNGQYSASMSLVIPLGGSTTAVASGNYGGSSRQASYEVQRNLRQGPGYGYRVRANTFDRSALDASFSYQNEQGGYTVEAGRSSGQTSFRAYERSSLSFLHGRFLTSRWLDDSFGVVHVPGQKNVSVYVNNHLSGRTNRFGTLLVPRLVPYDRNVVRIEENDVPLDSSADIGERTVIPYPRSGVYMKFTAGPIVGATIRLVRLDGTPVPQGASVSLDGSSNTYEVAMRGEVFVTEMHYPALLTAVWEDGRCTVQIPGPAPEEPLPVIGPMMCR
ncbi:MAG: fimbria/pilus outer membrane usher protein [Bryobacteraceae bacterium]